MKLTEALKIGQRPAPEGAPLFRVYLACSFTPLHLETFLKAYLLEEMPQRNVEVEVGTYGDLSVNLARLQNSGCDAGVVLLEWADLHLRLGLRSLGGWGPKVLVDIQETVEQAVGRILRSIEDAAPFISLAVSMPTLPLPPISYLPASQYAHHALMLRRTIDDFALRLAVIPGVKLVNPQRLDELSTVAERLDVKSELTAGFPYRVAHAASLAGLLARLIHPRPAKKGLITDLDDTLWCGLVGEQGASGVSWDLDSRSHIHALYQQVLAALAESGVLVGVASKNDPALVLEALERQDLILPKDRIFPLEIHWHQKSHSVDNVLRAWNVSADSVVFVDDNEMELAEVHARHPEMECLLFPKNDLQAAYQLLERLRDLFGKPEILDEDAIRLDSVRRMARFQTETKDAPASSLADFLEQVEAQLTFSAVDTAKEARAFELINKTNQFNINGRRLTPAEFQAALKRLDSISMIVSYKDKFGPLGNIAVILGNIQSSLLKIDTWVMSCRAFSRHIEYRCLEYLFEQWDVSEIEVDYRPTDRNGPTREFLKQVTREEPNSDCRISRAVFASSKPALFHRVNDASYV